ncbi:MAG: VOC family protein, partial [Mycobacterium sp.]
MPIAFNHTIVAARDKRESAEFVSELFGMPSPASFGRFLVVE